MKYTHWVWISDVDDETCDRLIEENSQGLREAPVATNECIVMNKSIRRSQINLEPSQEALDLCEFYTNAANKQGFAFNVYGLGTCQLARYSEEDQGKYDWHVDSFSGFDMQFDRKLTCVIFLSDPDTYEGGALQISYRSEDFKLPKGSVIVFPSYELHRVTPVTRGVRYSLVGWAEGPNWR